MVDWVKGRSEAQALAEPWTRQGGPGGAIVLFGRDGVRESASGGFAVIEHRLPFTPDTQNRLASISKHICAALLLREGVPLDATLGSFMPELPEAVGAVTDLVGCEALNDVVLVDQSPIGRSPRSNPITYVKAFDDIRQLFAAQPLSHARGYSPTTFSFNAVQGGRCTSCDGAGHVQIEMVFLADVFVPCDACGGTRYERDVLDVKIKGLSICDVLQLTVDEAIQRFRHQDKLGRMLWHLQQVGLGYLRLGQPATTLSGGEAQRLKIARQLANVVRKTERRLYILDEPTTGLHLDDVRTLLKVLDRLVDAGHTVVVIEHHVDVIKRADWVIDLGPEGGGQGGRIVAQGTPEEVAESGTHTGGYLRQALATPTESTTPHALTS